MKKLVDSMAGLGVGAENVLAKGPYRNGGFTRINEMTRESLV